MLTAAKPKRFLLLGLGNEVLADDAVGLRVVRALRAPLSCQAEVDVEESSEMGLALLDFLVGRESVVVVDAIQTGKVPPGTISEVVVDGLRRQGQRTPHFLGVGDTLAMGRELGLEMPRSVLVVGIEARDFYTLSTQMTPELESRLEEIIGDVLVRVRAFFRPIEAGCRSERG